MISAIETVVTATEIATAEISTESNPETTTAGIEETTTVGIEETTTVGIVDTTTVGIEETTGQWAGKSSLITAHGKF